ncbi:hypothetical protein KAT67_05435, partial [candidate division WOR-3 bacterium]|nr:hypothetical protein [candidate division WOR-3 bacterium]
PPRWLIFKPSRPVPAPTSNIFLPDIQDVCLTSSIMLVTGGYIEAESLLAQNLSQITVEFFFLIS